MSVIEARAVLSAVDKGLGAVLDKVAKKFKDVGASAKALSEVKPVKFTGNWSEELAKLKLTQKEIEAVNRSFQNFDKALKAKPIRASSYFEAVSVWKGKTLSDLRAVRESMEQTRLKQEQMFKGVRGGARMAVGALGVGSAAYLANRGVRGTIGAGATMMRESARDYLAGMSDTDSARIKAGAMDLSTRYNSLDASTMHERLRDTAMSVRSVDKAMELGDTLARGQVVLQSLVGKERAPEQSRKFLRGLDTLGKNIDPQEIKTLYDGYIKAQGVEGNDMDLGDILRMSQMSKSGGATLDNRFLMSVAPGLMQDIGPARLGTALGSSMSQVIGGRATKKSKAAQMDYGLRDKQGNFLNDREVMSNPFDYTLNRLVPALQKKGVDVNDNVAVTRATSQLFSNQMVADLFTKMITQREQYSAKGEQYAKAPGLAAATELPKRDPFVAAEGFVSQLKNFAASLAEPAFPAATATINALSGALGNLAKTYSEETGIGKAGMLGVGGAVGGLAAYKGLKMASGAYQWFTGAGALNGSALALNESAAALTMAATRLGASSVASAATTPAASAAAGAGGASIWSRMGSAVTGALAIPYAPALIAGAAALGAGAVIGEAKKEAGTFGMTGAEGAKKVAGGRSRVEILRDQFNEDRAKLGLAPTEAGSGTKEPVKAEIEGNATLTGNITVAPSSYFMTTIDTRIDNKINAFKQSNVTGRGTAGDTGRSSPDASSSP